MYKRLNQFQTVSEYTIKLYYNKTYKLYNILFIHPVIKSLFDLLQNVKNSYTHSRNC